MSPYRRFRVTKTGWKLLYLSPNIVELSCDPDGVTDLQDLKSPKFAFANLVISRY
jgi:hypothetical protein